MKNATNLRPRSRYSLVVPTLSMLALLLFSADVFAQELELPYNQGLKAFQASLRGPVPFAISLVGIVACGAMLIFGGEISGFMRTMIFIILVVAVIVQADNVVKGLGGVDSDATGNVSVPNLSRASLARALS